ncbi:hypothetical protein B0T26DRAFT_680393 [Lasiosphaeria miniovina]|uniref:VWFA domain-containing protein n=1 Tax=Lasiosphaeria miniovina TaxID=1954250 RepID=A0AA40A046_9PEZI|nr:uncharacterized protein B0T26DRAFT_680393 [Lasiosphaeria miniovina]KAK0706755.1 hypothetical protein B0T26DRAFT_680393 [Lasiosphaeria miniovina]
MTSPVTNVRRSIFGSVKDKFLGSGKKSRSPSPNPFASPEQIQPPSPVSPYQSHASPVFPPPAELQGENEVPPPPYTESTRRTAPNTPAIVLSSPRSQRGVSPAPSAGSGISMASISSPDDKYGFLSIFDTKFLIDDSGSMAGAPWREVKEVLRTITSICTERDSDGIDVYFLNARNRRCDDGTGGFKNIKRPEEVEELFRRVHPGGHTLTGTRINDILKPWMREYAESLVKERDQRNGDTRNSNNIKPVKPVKPVNMIVITDGAPQDDPRSVIVSVAKKLDVLEAPPYQVGIQFFQVGNEETAATALKELDDNLGKKYDVRDIVDTVTWDHDSGPHVLTAESILKVVLGAVNKRYDDRPTRGESSRPEMLSPRRR